MNCLSLHDRRNSWKMATGLQNQVEFPENLRKQLALAVRSIQWSYAVYWSISSTQTGALEWGDGYYNGDIKTRKTVQAVELDDNQIGLQRSDQLRELYESLAAGESSPQIKRPSAALSPEDLTDTEWYYLVCMSFVFDFGQGLPGKAFENGRLVWLRNAHNADSKVFCRSLLAKSASIQTVVCFPFVGGVVEMGVTDLVSEDPSLIQHVKSSFLENPNMNEILAFPLPDHEILDEDLHPFPECDLTYIVSPTNSSNGCEQDHPAEISYIVEDIDGGTPPIQRWQFMDEDPSNCIHNSVNSSDCISQCLVDLDKVAPIPKSENVISQCVLDLQEMDQTKGNSVNNQSDDVHYNSILSTLLKSSDQLVLGPHCRNSSRKSGFIGWARELVGDVKIRSESSQKLLKKMLFEVARMHGSCSLKMHEENSENNRIWRPEVGETDPNCTLAERKRRERLNERFLMLRSLLPSKNQDDKVSMLDNTIEYLEGLERRVQELESCRELDLEKAQNANIMERSSDNYGHNQVGCSKKPLSSKRKACDIENREPEVNKTSSIGSYDKINVTMVENNVLIEIRCSSKEWLLLEIMDVLSNLGLDSQSVQSSNNGGVLSMSIKSKVKASAAPSLGMIKLAIQRIVHRS